MNAPVTNIQIARLKIEQRLDALRQQQGAALLDGEPFDVSQIAAAEAELAGLDAAETEAVRRDTVQMKVSRRQEFDKGVTDFKAAMAGRLGALTEAEGHFRAFAGSLRKAQDQAATALAISNRLTNDPNSNPVLTPTNFASRVAGYLRAVLRPALGGRHFGGLDLSPMPSDPKPTDAWAEVEKAHGDLVTYFKRIRPTD